MCGITPGPPSRVTQFNFTFDSDLPSDRRDESASGSVGCQPGDRPHLQFPIRPLILLMLTLCRSHHGRHLLATQETDPMVSRVGTPPNGLISPHGRPDQDNEAGTSSWWESFCLNQRRILFAVEAGLDVGTLLRWRPHVNLTNVVLTDDDHECVRGNRNTTVEQNPSEAGTGTSEVRRSRASPGCVGRRIDPGVIARVMAADRSRPVKAEARRGLATGPEVGPGRLRSRLGPGRELAGRRGHARGCRISRVRVRCHRGIPGDDGCRQRSRPVA